MTEAKSCCTLGWDSYPAVYRRAHHPTLHLLFRSRLGLILVDLIGLEPIRLSACKANSGALPEAQYLVVHIGFEPIHPYGKRVTASHASPTASLHQIYLTHSRMCMLKHICIPLGLYFYSSWIKTNMF